MTACFSPGSSQIRVSSCEEPDQTIFLIFFAASLPIKYSTRDTPSPSDLLIASLFVLFMSLDPRLRYRVFRFQRLRRKRQPLQRNESSVIFETPRDHGSSSSLDVDTHDSLFRTMTTASWRLRGNTLAFKSSVSSYTSRMYFVFNCYLLRLLAIVCVHVVSSKHDLPACVG